MKYKIEYYVIMALSQEKRGGPYTTQNEVLKLHFEYGYPATKIADLMKINRNTINDDINQGYEQLSKDWNKYDLDSWLMKQIQRFESQRSRLLQELEKQGTIKEKLQIEKLIYEIDCKIAQIILNDHKINDEVYTKSIDCVNRWAEEKKIDLKITREMDIVKTTPKKLEMITKIIRAKHSNFELIEKSVEKPVF